MKTFIFISFFAALPSAFGNDLSNAILVDVHDKIPADVIKTCGSNLPKIAVTVDLRESPVVESNDQNVRSLTNLALEKNNPHAKNHFILGLTTIELNWHANAVFKSYNFANPSISCARPEMKVNLTMLYHRVQIAKELSPGSCEYKFIRAHEYRHVEINNENVKAYVNAIANESQQHFQSKIYYGSIKAVETAVHNEINKNWLPFIEKTAKDLEKKGNARQSQIDTPEEYAKSNLACSGSIARMINEHYGKQ